MRSYTITAALVSAAAVANAQTSITSTTTITSATQTAAVTPRVTLPASTPVSAVIRDDYANTTPPWATGTWAEVLATAVYGEDKKFYNADGYAKIFEDVFSAGVAQGRNYSSSLIANGWEWDAVTTAPFYSKVPETAKTQIANYLTAWKSAEASVSQAAAGGTSTTVSSTVSLAPTGNITSTLSTPTTTPGNAPATTSSSTAGGASGPKATALAMFGAAGGVFLGFAMM